MTIIGALLLCASFALAVLGAVIRSRGDNTGGDHVLCVLAGMLFSVVMAYGRSTWFSMAMGGLGTGLAITIMYGLAHVLTSLRRVRPPSE